MQQNADVLGEILRSLQNLGNGLGAHGTFRMRVLLGMLLHEVIGEIERREDRGKKRDEPAV